MYSKIKIAGLPVHPMLVAFPVACYTGTLVGFAVYAANGHLERPGGKRHAWRRAVCDRRRGHHRRRVPGLDAGAGLSVGVRLTPEQELAEQAVQHSHVSLLHRHAA